MAIYLNFVHALGARQLLSIPSSKYAASEKYFTINSRLFCNFFIPFFSFILSYCIVHLRIVGQWKTKHTKPPIVAVHNIYVDFHEKNFFGFDIIKISSTFYDFNNKFSFHSWN